ncbi:MAG: band 7 protein [Planctomycetales bacterium]|nr:band 7 protein [Planctomycetales bacterium]
MTSTTMRRAQISFGMAALFLLALGYVMFQWTINRVYVPPGQSLMLRYKGPLLPFVPRKQAQLGHWAQEGEVGVLQKMRGPGRHFYCPIWYERTLENDVVIEPGNVGIVTCKLGDSLPAGQFLVDGDLGETEYKGILRKVLGPGRYRVNPYGYTVQKVSTVREGNQNQLKFSGWVEIPTGYVGVVTNLAANPKLDEQPGIQANVLPPGIFPINGREKQIDIVEVGYRESTVSVTKMRNPDGSLKVDEAGEPMIAAVDDGINFPSSDGFPIHMDFTAIWGIMPDQAPHAIRTFGNVTEVELKVVQPQIESTCRNNGSEYSAVELLVGEQREGFQESNLAEFKSVLTEKQITLLYGLVRHIYIPKEVRQPIQTAFIADELKLTREQEQATAREEAALREAERTVELESERVRVETQKLVAEKLAEGQKEVGEIEAETRKLVAEIQKETAKLEAAAQLALGDAENAGKKMVEEAKANRFALAVEAFGTPEAYNNWMFATGLPDNVELKLLYAGEGTLWTDMENVGVRANLPLQKKDK